MKKLTSSMIAVAMASLFVLPVSAENTTGGSSTISTTVKEAYTIVIPETLEIPYESTAPKTLMLTAQNMLLESNKKVVVNVRGSGTNGAFTMNNQNHTLAYELSKTQTPWNVIAIDGEVATFTTDGVASIYAKVPNWNVTAAGKYSGTITFDISYQNK